MRKLLLLCLVVLFSMPALAADKVTVAQLQQQLAAAHGKSDKYLEKHIANLQLTERLDRRELLRLSQSLPGKKSQDALLVIADASAFLDPPRSEVIIEGPPPAKTQGEILIRAAKFVAAESKRMPNFLARRTSTRFHDAINFAYSSRINYFTPGNFHFVDRKAVTVRYLGGKEEEMHERGQVKDRPNIVDAPMGLTTWGAFGPLLVTVTADILQSKVGWARWEGSGSDKRAVFRFFVPREKSHYTLEYCCTFEHKQGGLSTMELTVFKATPAYHGEITIDSETGHVLRIVLFCDLVPGQVITRAGAELEYGPREIAGQSYFLPMRGVSFSTIPVTVSQWVGQQDPHPEPDRYALTSINDLQFEDYRVFRTEMRILPAETADKSPQ